MAVERIKNVAGWLAGLMALVLAVAYVLTARHPLVVMDARDYLDAALSVFGNGHPVNGIVRNQILRTPWYILLISSCNLLYPYFGDNGVVLGVRLLQAGLYAFNIVLVFRIGDLLGGRRTAWLATIFSLLYLPQLFAVGRVLTEVEATTFLLLFAWCWLKDRPVAAGIFLFLGLSTHNWFGLWAKLAFMLPLLLLVFWQNRDPAFRSKLKKTALSLLIGSLLLQVVTWLVPHRPLPSQGLWYYGDTFGWAPLVPAEGMRSFVDANDPRVLLDALHGRNAAFAQIVHWLFRELPGPLVLFGANVFRLFARPDNVYGLSWLGLSPAFIVAWHQLLILLALCGLPMLSENRRLLLLWLLPAAYLVYALVHIEARYNLPLMPFLFLAAALAVDVFWRRRDWQTPLALLFFWLLIRLPWYPPLLVLLPGLSLTFYRWLGMGLLAILAADILSRVLHDRRRAVLLALPLFLPALCQAWLMPPASEWSIRLTPHLGVQRTIPVDGRFWADADWRTFLVIDGVPPVSDGNDLAITVNGLPVPSANQAPPMLGKLEYLLGGLLTPADIRQYRYLPLPTILENSIRKTGVADIQVRLKPEARMPLLLYGDYSISRHQMAIPSPDWSTFSIYKAQYEGDGRLPLLIVPAGRTMLTGSPEALGSKDLSPAPGLQTGQVRIFLFRYQPGNPELPAPSLQLDAAGHLSKTFQIAD